MAKNKLEDLGNHLFAQLERLGDEDLSKEEIELEMKRAKSICGIASNIVSSGRLALDVIEFTVTEKPSNVELPRQLKINN